MISGIISPVNALLLGIAQAAAKRNRERFPDDFMFQLDPLETEDRISQDVISDPELKRGVRKGNFSDPHSYL